MELRDGREFAQATPSSVAEFLRSRRIRTHVVEPDRLHLATEGQDLILRVNNGSSKTYPVRRSFLHKLTNWFSFPIHHMARLNGDTVASILNDFLLNIRSPKVTVTIEDDEALTITSDHFADLPDLQVLEMCKQLGIDSVSRNDFFMRIYTETLNKTEAIPGDICGLGFNIMNSETGFRALSVDHFLFRYVCSNGAVIPFGGERSRRSHYDCTKDDLKEWLSMELTRGKELQKDVILNLRKSTESTATEEEKRNLAMVVRRNAGQQIHRERIDEILAARSRYELFNVATNIARSLPSGPRLRLEEYGGRIISMGSGGGG